MTSMLDQVAKAIERADTGMVVPYEELARAAIEAMRDPTAAMIAAGGEAYYGQPREKAVEWAKEDKFDLHASDAVIFYRAMIDTALAESKEG